jgi:hypothetical protein
MKNDILILIGVFSFIYILTIKTNVLEGFAISGLGLLDHCPIRGGCNIIREGDVECHSSCAPGACEEGNNSPTGCTSCPNLPTTSRYTRYMPLYYSNAETGVEKILDSDLGPGQCNCPPGKYYDGERCLSENWVIGDPGQSCDTACRMYPPHGMDNNECINAMANTHRYKWGSLHTQSWTFMPTAVSEIISNANSREGHGAFQSGCQEHRSQSTHGASPKLYSTEEIGPDSNYMCQHNSAAAQTQQGLGTCETVPSGHDRRICKCNAIQSSPRGQPCDTSGTWYNPLGERSAETTWQDCRQRAQNEGMPYFNYFGPANKGCHPSTGADDPTDGHLNLGTNKTTHSGASMCI